MAAARIWEGSGTHGGRHRDETRESVYREKERFGLGLRTSA
jgi:hypothetical protein